MDGVKCVQTSSSACAVSQRRASCSLYQEVLRDTTAAVSPPGKTTHRNRDYIGFIPRWHKLVPALLEVLEEHIESLGLLSVVGNLIRPGVKCGVST